MLKQRIVEIESVKAAEVIDTPTGPVEVEMDEDGWSRSFV
jgi:hypothetical protein